MKDSSNIPKSKLPVPLKLLSFKNLVREFIKGDFQNLVIPWFRVLQNKIVSIGNENSTGKRLRHVSYDGLSLCEAKEIVLNPRLKNDGRKLYPCKVLFKRKVIHPLEIL